MDNTRYKYRGKSVTTGEWVYGDLNRGLHKDAHKRYIAYAGLYSNIEVDPKTVGQCTGLTDSKGVSIYEDDLLQDTDGNIYRVWQEPGKWLYGGVNKEWDDYMSKLNEYSTVVKGSIHDKPTQ